MAQLVKQLTLDFSSGHNLKFHEITPQVGLWADSVEPAWDSLSPSLFAPPLLSLKINKHIKKKFLAIVNFVSFNVLSLQLKSLVIF